MMRTPIPGRMPPENPSVSNPLRVDVVAVADAVGVAGFESFPQPTALTARITSAVHENSNRRILTMVATPKRRTLPDEQIRCHVVDRRSAACILLSING